MAILIIFLLLAALPLYLVFPWSTGRRTPLVLDALLTVFAGVLLGEIVGALLHREYTYVSLNQLARLEFWSFCLARISSRAWLWLLGLAIFTPLVLPILIPFRNRPHMLRRFVLLALALGVVVIILTPRLSSSPA